MDQLVISQCFTPQKIYCLIDPITWDVMYIGKTRNTALRFRSHVSLAVNERYKSSKRDWILYLRKFHNDKPILQVLCECTEEDVNLWEHFYTKIFAGYPLVNSATILKETMQYSLFN